MSQTPSEPWSVAQLHTSSSRGGLAQYHRHAEHEKSHKRVFSREDGYGGFRAKCRSRAHVSYDKHSGPIRQRSSLVPKVEVLRIRYLQQQQRQQNVSSRCRRTRRDLAIVLAIRPSPFVECSKTPTGVKEDTGGDTKAKVHFCCLQNSCVCGTSGRCVQGVFRSGTRS